MPVNTTLPDTKAGQEKRGKEVSRNREAGYGKTGGDKGLTENLKKDLIESRAISKKKQETETALQNQRKEIIQNEVKKFREATSGVAGSSGVLPTTGELEEIYRLNSRIELDNNKLGKPVYRDALGGINQDEPLVKEVTVDATGALPKQRTILVNGTPKVVDNYPLFWSKSRPGDIAIPGDVNDYALDDNQKYKPVTNDLNFKYALQPELLQATLNDIANKLQTDPRYSLSADDLREIPNGNLYFDVLRGKITTKYNPATTINLYTVRTPVRLIARDIEQQTGKPFYLEDNNEIATDISFTNRKPSDVSIVENAKNTSDTIARIYETLAGWSKPYESVDRSGTKSAMKRSEDTGIAKQRQEELVGGGFERGWGTAPIVEKYKREGTQVIVTKDGVPTEVTIGESEYSDVTQIFGNVLQAGGEIPLQALSASANTPTFMDGTVIHNPALSTRDEYGSIIDPMLPNTVDINPNLENTPVKKEILTIQDWMFYGGSALYDFGNRTGNLIGAQLGGNTLQYLSDPDKPTNVEIFGKTFTVPRVVKGLWTIGANIGASFVAPQMDIVSRMFGYKDVGLLIKSPFVSKEQRDDILKAGDEYSKGIDNVQKTFYNLATGNVDFFEGKHIAKRDGIVDSQTANLVWANKLKNEVPFAKRKLDEAMSEITRVGQQEYEGNLEKYKYITESITDAREIFKEYYQTESVAASIINGRDTAASYTFGAHQNNKDEYYNALADATMQNGGVLLTRNEQNAIKELYLDSGTELLGQMTYDLLNIGDLIPAGIGLVKGAKVAGQFSGTRSVADDALKVSLDILESRKELAIAGNDAETVLNIMPKIDNVKNLRSQLQSGNKDAVVGAIQQVLGEPRLENITANDIVFGTALYRVPKKILDVTGYGASVVLGKLRAGIVRLDQEETFASKFISNAGKQLLKLEDATRQSLASRKVAIQRSTSRIASDALKITRDEYEASQLLDDIYKVMGNIYPMEKYMDEAKNVERVRALPTSLKNTTTFRQLLSEYSNFQDVRRGATLNDFLNTIDLAMYEGDTELVVEQLRYIIDNWNNIDAKYMNGLFNSAVDVVDALPTGEGSKSWGTYLTESVNQWRADELRRAEAYYIDRKLGGKSGRLQRNLRGVLANIPIGKQNREIATLAKEEFDALIGDIQVPINMLRNDPTELIDNMTKKSVYGFTGYHKAWNGTKIWEDSIWAGTPEAARPFVNKWTEIWMGFMGLQNKVLLLDKPGWININYLQSSTTGMLTDGLDGVKAQAISFDRIMENFGDQVPVEFKTSVGYTTTDTGKLPLGKNPMETMARAAIEQYKQGDNPFKLVWNTVNFKKMFDGMRQSNAAVETTLRIRNFSMLFNKNKRLLQPLLDSIEDKFSQKLIEKGMTESDATKWGKFISLQMELTNDDVVAVTSKLSDLSKNKRLAGKDGFSAWIPDDMMRKASLSERNAIAQSLVNRFMDYTEGKYITPELITDFIDDAKMDMVNTYAVMKRRNEIGLLVTEINERQLVNHYEPDMDISDLWLEAKKKINAGGGDIEFTESEKLIIDNAGFAANTPNDLVRIVTEQTEDGDKLRKLIGDQAHLENAQEVIRTDKIIDDTEVYNAFDDGYTLTESPVKSAIEEARKSGGEQAYLHRKFLDEKLKLSDNVDGIPENVLQLRLAVSNENNNVISHEFYRKLHDLLYEPIGARYVSGTRPTPPEWLNFSKGVDKLSNVIKPHLASMSAKMKAGAPLEPLLLDNLLREYGIDVHYENGIFDYIDYLNPVTNKVTRLTDLSVGTDKYLYKSIREKFSVADLEQDYMGNKISDRISELSKSTAQLEEERWQQTLQIQKDVIRNGAPIDIESAVGRLDFLGRDFEVDDWNTITENQKEVVLYNMTHNFGLSKFTISEEGVVRKHRKSLIDISKSYLTRFMGTRDVEVNPDTMFDMLNKAYRLANDYQVPIDDALEVIGKPTVEEYLKGLSEVMRLQFNATKRQSKQIVTLFDKMAGVWSYLTNGDPSAGRAKFWNNVVGEWISVPSDGYIPTTVQWAENGRAVITSFKGKKTSIADVWEQFFTAMMGNKKTQFLPENITGSMTKFAKKVLGEEATDTEVYAFLSKKWSAYAMERVLPTDDAGVLKAFNGVRKALQTIYEDVLPIEPSDIDGELFDIFDQIVLGYKKEALGYTNPIYTLADDADVLGERAPPVVPSPQTELEIKFGDVWDAMLNKPRYPNGGTLRDIVTGLFGEDEYDLMSDGYDGYRRYLDKLTDIVVRGNDYDNIAVKDYKDAVRALYDEANGWSKYFYDFMQGKPSYMPIATMREEDAVLTWMAKQDAYAVDFKQTMDMLDGMRKHMHNLLGENSFLNKSAPQQVIDTLDEMGGDWVKLRNDVRQASIRGGVVNGISTVDAVEETQRRMFDYGNFSKLDDIMRSVVPYWMFASRITTFMYEMLAKHPEVAAFYSKYLHYSERQARDHNLVDSRGNVLKSMKGYIYVPGLDVWVNPLSPLVYRQFEQMGMVFFSPGSSDYMDEKPADESPVRNILTKVKSDMQSMGLSPSLLVDFILTQGANVTDPRYPRGNAVQNVSSYIALMRAIPPWAERSFTATLRQYAGMSMDLAPETLQPEISWIDYARETALIEKAYQYITEGNGKDWTDTQKLEYVTRIQKIIATPSERTPKNALWKEAIETIDNSQYLTDLTGWLTGFYPKQIRDGYARLQDIKHKNQMTRELINNVLGVPLFGVEGTPNERYNEYTEYRYKTPEGILTNAASKISWVTDQNGNVLQGKDRLEEIMNSYNDEQIIQSGIETRTLYKEKRDADLRALPIGAPSKAKSAIYEAYSENIQELDYSYVFNAGNKPVAMIADYFSEQWWRLVNSTKPYRQDTETWAQYQARLKEWQDDIPMIAKSMMTPFRLKLEVYQTKFYAGQDVSWLPDKLLKETTDKNLIVKELDTDSIYKAADNAWFELIGIGDYYALGDEPMRQKREQLQKEFLDNMVTPTTDQITKWIKDRYGSRFTDEEIRLAVEGRDILDFDSYVEYDDDKANAVVRQREDAISEAYSIMNMAVGSKYQMLKDAYTNRGGSGTDFDLFYEFGGFSDDVKLLEFVNRLRNAAGSIGLYGEKVDQELIVKAESENYGWWNEVENNIALKADVVWMHTYFYTMTTKEQSKWRAQNPELYKQYFKDYYDLKNKYAKSHPDWQKVYYADYKPYTKRIRIKGIRGWRPKKRPGKWKKWKKALYLLNRANKKYGYGWWFPIIKPRTQNIGDIYKNYR